MNDDPMGPMGRWVRRVVWDVRWGEYASRVVGLRAAVGWKRGGREVDFWKKKKIEKKEQKMSVLSQEIPP